MSRFFHLCLLLGFLALIGCGPFQYATSPQVNPRTGQTEIPAVQAGQEILQGGLTGLETAGIWGGLAGLVITTAKSFARIYSDYRAATAKNKAGSPA